MFQGEHVNAEQSIIWFSSGQQPTRYYYCSGQDPNKFATTIKYHYFKQVLRIVSLIVRICFGFRILMYKYGRNQNTNSIKSYLTSQSLSDLMICLAAIGMFVAAVVPGILVKEIASEDLNKYPNYIYVYLQQIVVPILISISSIILYILWNPKLRSSVRTKVYRINI